MPYVTGTALSFADLLTALRNACTSNGWTLSGNVLHKGTCYAEVLQAGMGDTGAPADGGLHVRAGNGIDGSNLLTDTVTAPVRMGILKAVSGETWPDWDWPVTYHIHVHASPDEVFLVVNYEAGARFQWLAFGQSPSPGNAGTGNWHSSIAGRPGLDARRIQNGSYHPDGGNIRRSGGQIHGCGPFFWGNGREDSAAVYLGSGIHGAIDNVSGLPVWSNDRYFACSTGGSNQGVNGGLTVRPLLGFSPNAWNNETHLIPIQIIQERPDLKTSLIGELQHIRMCRNDYIGPGDVITLGPDQWKVYPCYKKDAANRNGPGATTAGDHSGTVAMAIRYDGP